MGAAASWPARTPTLPLEVSEQGGPTVPQANEDATIVVAAAVRTPIGRFGGGLAGVGAVTLGATAIRAALAHADLPGDAVDRVLMGHVIQAGAGQNPARQAAVGAGIGLQAPAETLNKVCLSGMSAVAHARDLLRLGEAEVVVAGGMEAMSDAPHLLDRSRTGYRFGDGRLVDVLLSDGLTCAFDACSMGLATERHQVGRGISRDDQDRWAVRSHERAAAAADGRTALELVPVEVSDGRGGTRTVTADEGVRPDIDLARLAALRPAFEEDGTITAGNASQLSDGAAALVLTTDRVARARGLPVLARILATGATAGPDLSLLHQPAAAIRRAAQRAGLEPAGLDLYEINEAFASVAITAQRDLGVDVDRINVVGGAIALGHPLGCSGARILVTLLHALRQRGGGRGAAALCGGGGQGEAVILEVAA
jgi:acetyl-CoA C-acetyltransferase